MPLFLAYPLSPYTFKDTLGSSPMLLCLEFPGLEYLLPTSCRLLFKSLLPILERCLLGQILYHSDVS